MVTTISIEVLPAPKDPFWLQARCSARGPKNNHPWAVTGDPDYVFRWVRSHVIDHAKAELVRRHRAEARP